MRATNSYGWIYLIVFNLVIRQLAKKTIFAGKK